MLCPECKNHLNEEVRFCEFCGNDLDLAESRLALSAEKSVESSRIGVKQ